MKKMIQYGLLVAAGVGMFEILRRTGMLQQAGEWLSDQVPDDVKTRVRKVGDQVRETVHDVEERVGQTFSSVVDQAGHLVGRVKETAEPVMEAAGKVSDNLHNGKSVTTEDSDGGAVPHSVGRGVIH